MYLSERTRVLFSYQNHLHLILLGASAILVLVSLSFFAVLQWQFKATLNQVQTQHTEQLLNQIGQQSIRFLKQGDQRHLQYVADSALNTPVIAQVSIFDAQGILTAKAQTESFQATQTRLHVLEITEFSEKTVGYIQAQVSEEKNIPWQLLHRLQYQLWALSLCLLFTGILMCSTWTLWRKKRGKIED